MKTGRIAQKNRTRKALIKAAWEMLASGVQPTVEEVAQAADISRATAYRYFPSRERLLIEAVLSRESKSPREILARETGKSPSDRAVRIHSYIYEQITKNETLYRSLVRCSIEEWIKNKDRMILRADERLELLEEVLQPIAEKTTDEEFDNLVHALAALIGVESYIALRDVCHLNRGRIHRVISWAVKTLVDSVISGKK